ncbi:Uncharacterised protein [Dermatophilus congolensis]|uniref:Uncharacterized protein n=1 Tax=Dermatophilus congolensis TaxID=1863 RepID=A0A239VAZ3_9MICO|nr:Uncharacterised protein [Dermatophilus congolensis]
MWVVFWGAILVAAWCCRLPNRKLRWSSCLVVLVVAGGQLVCLRWNSSVAAVCGACVFSHSFVRCRVYDRSTAIDLSGQASVPLPLRDEGVLLVPVGLFLWPGVGLRLVCAEPRLVFRLLLSVGARRWPGAGDRVTKAQTAVCAVHQESLFRYGHFRFR